MSFQTKLFNDEYNRTDTEFEVTKFDDGRIAVSLSSESRDELIDMTLTEEQINQLLMFLS